MISRRGFLAAGGAVLAGRVVPSFPSPVRQGSADTYFAWEEIAPGVRLAWGGGALSMVVSSEGESLLVDCKGYGLGTTLRREAEADGSRLVAAVNTHHHAAQHGGNIAFTTDLRLIAHRNAGPRIVASVERVVDLLQQDPDGETIADRRRQIFEAAHSDAGAQQALADFDALVGDNLDIVPGNYGPTDVFEDSLTVRVGAIDVELYHFGRAHTDNDLVVWVPAHGIMHVGNLVYIDAHPFVDAPGGGDTRGWQRFLRRAGEVTGPEAVILPSDGGLVAAAHDFDSQSAYFDEVRALVQNALDAGMSRQETVDFIPSTRMGRFVNLSSPERLPVTLGAVYDQLSAR